MKRKSYKIFKFTLIELITAMALFSVLMLIMMRFFGEAQKAWTESSKRSMVFDNAKIAMDLISRDLQCVMYTENDASSLFPFWHENSGRINFMTVTNVRSEAASSSICEVKYARSDGTITNTDLAGGTFIDAGWLIRSVTANDLVVDTNPANASNKYNYDLCPKDPLDTDRVYSVWKGIDGSAVNTSSADFAKIIPYVVDLEFICFGVDNDKNAFYNMQNSSGSGADDGDYEGNSGADWLINWPNTGTTAKPTPLPFSIQINLTLLDKDSWNKWKAMVGAVNWNTVVIDPDGTELATDASRIFREKMQRKFTKMIFLGNRNL
jgi:type II secretory pathway pseudopilin PulG